MLLVAKMNILLLFQECCLVRLVLMVVKHVNFLILKIQLQIHFNASPAMQDIKLTKINVFKPVKKALIFKTLIALFVRSLVQIALVLTH